MKVMGERKFFSIVLIAVMIICVGSRVAAKEDKEKDAKESAVQDTLLEVGTMTGELISFYPRNEPKFVGINDAGKNAEYHFLMNENVEVINKKALSELLIGDRVEITFDKIKKASKSDIEKIEYRVKSIRFVRAAVKEDNMRSE